MADIENCPELSRILAIYEKASGQNINLTKSTVFLSPNISQTNRNELLEALWIHSVLNDEKYLGLPMVLGKSKKSFLVTLRTEFGDGLRGGRRNFCQKREGKF